jgi:hypothetical protein
MGIGLESGAVGAVLNTLVLSFVLAVLIFGFEVKFYA